jgi:N,N-dimethylformamidase beta subunit-like protein
VRRTPIVIFGVLVAATFAAFFVAQRLKNAPSVVQQFNAYYVFSPNGDGRLDRARVTFKVKKADRVTVEMVDSDGDPVKTLLDDRHLDAYAPIKPALRWDGTDDDGKVVPDGRYRVRITLRHLGRSVVPQRSILKDTKPPQPKVLSIGPTKVYGPELLPEPEGGKAEVHFGPALGTRAKIHVFRTGPGAPREARTEPLRAGQTQWDWDGTDGDGQRVSPGTYVVVPEWRDTAGNIGTGVPLDRKGLPILTRGRLPGRGGVTVRYLGAQVPVTPAKARDRVEIQVDARQQRYSWNVRRAGDPVIRAHSTKPKTKTKVVFSAPGGKSGVYVLTANTASRSTRVVFPVQARQSIAGTRAKPRGVLVVLPYVTWQGRNAADDDGDGAPNTLDLGVPVRPVRIMAGDGLPVGFTEQEGQLLRWLDHNGKRYDVTTDLALALKRGPRLAGHHGVLIPGDARWLPASVRVALRAFVKAGGTVVSTGTDSLRRSVSLDAKGRLADPSPAKPTDLFGAKLAPIARKTTNLELFTEDPQVDLFHGADGLFPNVDTWEATDRVGDEADLVSNAVTSVTTGSKTVIVAARFGKGLVIRPGFPSFAHRVATNADPATSALMARMWTLLSR